MKLKGRRELVDYRDEFWNFFHPLKNLHMNKEYKKIDQIDPFFTYIQRYVKESGF